MLVSYADTAANAFSAEHHHALSSTQVRVICLYRDEVLVTSRPAAGRSSSSCIVSGDIHTVRGAFPVRTSGR